MSQAGGAPRGLWGVARVEVAACRRSGARREVHVAWRVSELRHVAGRGRAARFMLRGACRSCGMSRVGGAPRGLCCVARVGVAACRRPGPRREVHVAWRVSELRHVAGRGSAARTDPPCPSRGIPRVRAGAAPRPPPESRNSITRPPSPPSESRNLAPKPPQPPEKATPSKNPRARSVKG